MDKFRTVPTNLPDYLRFERPPKGLNLLRASVEELHSYGLPHRPDPKKDPRTHRFWHRVMSRVKEFVTPALTVRRDIVHGPPRNLRRSAVHSGKVVAGASSTENWSGVVLDDQAPYISVWGTWTVPAVQLPPGQSGIFYSATWVGLGGVVEGESLLQAGVEQDVGGNSWAQVGAYSAWVEWFPAPPVYMGTSSPPQFPAPLPDFPISPGQTIAVYIAAMNDGSGRGSFTMANLETGLALAPIVVPIPTVDFNGNPITPSITSVPSHTIEWIVERPSTVQPDGNIIPMELADFGEVNFTNAGGQFSATPGDKGGTDWVYYDNDPDSVTMLADDGVTPIAEEIETPAVHVTFQQTAAGQ
jgi:hypothetical protein